MPLAARPSRSSTGIARSRSSCTWRSTPCTRRCTPTTSGWRNSSRLATSERRTYAAMMSAMDDAIGAVLDKLREAELEDNTLVFFISDNGGPTMPGTSGNASINKPLRGSKRTTLEGGIRVPFFVKWPGRLPAGKVYDQPVIQLDILPTALAAAGVEIPADAKYRRRESVAVSQRRERRAAARCALLAVRPANGDSPGRLEAGALRPAVDGRQGRATESKLYNLADDIGENNDLMDEEPEKAAALQAAWDEWNKSNVRPLWGDGRGQQRNAGRRQQPAVN